MTSVADWFAARMGRQAPPQQQAPYAPQQQQYYPQTQYQPYPQQLVPGVPPAVALAAQGIENVDTSSLIAMVKAGDITFKQASSFWKGNPKGAAGRETMACPECGGPRYYQRNNTKLRNKDGVSVPPSSICWDCGYNDMFELQYGVTGEPGGHVSANS